MPFSQRIFLIIGSLATLIYFISNIRKSKLKINHSIFWAVFGIVLLLLALIPDGFWVANLLGFQSPSNLIYLIVIFLLTVKLFTTTMRLSRLSEQVTALTQTLALEQMKAEKAKEESEKCTGETAAV